MTTPYGEPAMAEGKKKRRVIKKTETIRDKTEKRVEDDKKPRQVRKVTDTVGRARQKTAEKGKKEYYLPLPDTRFGRWLNKRRSFIPQILKNAFKELKQVTWPNRSETFRLTVSVLLFAIFFGSLIAGVDYVLDNVFRRVILNL